MQLFVQLLEALKGLCSPFSCKSLRCFELMFRIRQRDLVLFLKNLSWGYGLGRVNFPFMIVSHGVAQTSTSI